MPTDPRGIRAWTPETPRPLGAHGGGREVRRDGTSDGETGVKIEGDKVVVELDDIARMGVGCLRRVATNTRVSWLTRAVAYCYEDWCAQQRMDDDGMAHRIWES